MINLNICREFYLYQKRLAQRETLSYFVDIPCSPYMMQYHNDGREIFGALYDKRKNFQQYIPKVDPN